jgi:PAS domain S-box-containing protein
MSLPLQGILNGLEEPIVVLDGTGRHVYSNPAFHRLLALQPGRLQGRRPPFPYWSPESVEALRTEVKAHLESSPDRPANGHLPAVFRTGGGRRIPVSLTFEDLRDADGCVRFHVTLVQCDRNAAQDLEWASKSLRARVGQLEGALRGVALQLARAGVDPPLLRRYGRIEGNDGFRSLSPREVEILDQLSDGQRVPVVAARLQISEHTVRAHLKSIFRKLGVTSQAELLDKLHPRS